MRARLADDRGETLIELIIAIAIMGIAVVAIVSGIAISILMSDVHRKQTNAGAYARDDAESLVAAGYRARCDYSLPTRDRYTDRVADVYSWNGSAFVRGCADTGLHKVSITVASTDTRASESVDVVIRSTS